jgi:hypothetical protein
VKTDFSVKIVEPRDGECRFPPLPTEILAILENKGLIPRMKKVLEASPVFHITGG